MPSVSPIIIRVPTKLRTEANKKAARMGVPLSMVMRQALSDFVSSDTVIISDPEIVEVPPAFQATLKRVGAKIDSAIEAKSARKE